MGAVAGSLSCANQQAPDEQHKNETSVTPLAQGSSGIPLVVLITLDTTRADHLGCYGYSKPTSPLLDSFADESLVYENAIAPGTWTLPSHASLFTGKFIASHGMRQDSQGSLPLSEGFPGPVEAHNKFRVRPLPDGELTLAALLSAAGFQTGAVVSGPWMKRVFGLDRGFEYYDDTGMYDLDGRTARRVTDGAMRWLRKPTDRPRFLFLNYFDPHTPYDPPMQIARRFLPAGKLPELGRELTLEEKAGMYDAEIAYMDGHVGRLFDYLRRAGLYDRALIVVTADHGELLGEHGTEFHGHIPYQEVVHIPMIVKSPADHSATGRNGEWIQLTDVLPLIFDKLELTQPDGIQGSAPPDVGHPIVMESYTSPERPYFSGGWLGMIDNGMKILWNDRGDHKLFDLTADPHENTNLVASRPELSKELSDSVQNYLASLPAPKAAGPSYETDAEMLKNLKSLGYLK